MVLTLTKVSILLHGLNTDQSVPLTYSRAGSGQRLIILTETVLLKMKVSTTAGSPNMSV